MRERKGAAWAAPLPEQVIAHTNLYRSHQRAPGQTAYQPPPV